MSLEAPVAAALSRIQNPRLGNDLLSAGMIRDLTVSSGSNISLTLPTYTAGTWGPIEADTLLGREGRYWRNAIGDK